MSESYVQAWEDELPEHPVIAELRAQPGRWAIIRTRVVGPRGPDMDAGVACVDHPNVETKVELDVGGGDIAMARWVPDPVLALVQLLKGGGYGG